MPFIEPPDPAEVAMFRNLADRIRGGPCGDVSFPDEARSLRFLHFAARELPVLLHGSPRPDLACLKPTYPSFRHDTDRQTLFASPSPLLVLEIVAWKLAGRRALFCYDYYGRLWGRKISLRGASIEPAFVDALREASATVYLCSARSFRLGWRRCWCDRLSLGVMRGLTEHVSEQRVTPLASVTIKLGTLFEGGWRHLPIEPRPWVALRSGLRELRWGRSL